MLQLITLPHHTNKTLEARLRKYNIPYVTRYLNENPLSFDEFKHLLYLTDNGTDDILNKSASQYKTLQKRQSFNELTLKQLYHWILNYPDLLKIPLLVDFDQEKLVTYFDNASISVFLPRASKQLEFLRILRYANQISPEREEEKECISI